MFLFFGVVAVVGSYFVQTEQLEWEAFALSVPVGLLASAILVVNNVRDVDTDRRAGQAHAGGEARPRPRAEAVRGDARDLVPRADRDLGVGGLTAWILLPILTRAAGRAARADRERAHRRPLAERARSPTPGGCSAVFSLLLSIGVLAS